MVKVYEAGEVYFDGKTPVPSYEKVKEMSQKNAELVSKTEQLEKRLDIATKALERIFYERDERAVGDYLWIANNALKEMKGVK